MQLFFNVFTKFFRNLRTFENYVIKQCISYNFFKRPEIPEKFGENVKK